MTLPRGMVSALAELCERRFHSARNEGQTERETFEELVTTILEMYIERSKNGLLLATPQGTRERRWQVL
jgi:hypothetical protein